MGSLNFAENFPTQFFVATLRDSMKLKEMLSHVSFLEYT